MRISVPKGLLSVRFSRSGGPGGQNVNKVETKVEVRLNLADLDVPPSVRERIAERLAGRITADGAISVASSRHRTRSRNLADCLERLQSLLEEAATPQAARVATAPTRASRARRRAGKRRHGLLKRQRRARPDEG